MKFLETKCATWPKLAAGRFLDLPATPSARNFCLPQKVRFSSTRSSASFIFFDNGLAKKNFCFVLGMNICNWKTYHLNDATLLFGSKWKWIHNWNFPKMRFLWKNNFGHFLLLFFFDFFSKNWQKVKVTNLTQNGQNYQIFVRNLLFEVFGHYLTNVLSEYYFYEFLWYEKSRA